MTVRRQLLLIACLAMLPCACPAAPSIDEQMKAALDTASSAGKRAAEYRDIAFRAVDNAVAAHDESEQALVRSLKSGKERAVSAAEKALEQSGNDRDGALDKLKDVLAYAAEIEAAAAAVSDAAKQVRETATEGEARDAAERAGKMAKVAAKALGKAAPLVEDLKRKWLLPAIGAPAPGAATNTAATPTSASVPPEPR